MDSTYTFVFRHVCRTMRAQPASARYNTLELGSSCSVRCFATAAAAAAVRVSPSSLRIEKRFQSLTVLTNVYVHSNCRTGVHSLQPPQQCAAAWQLFHSHSSSKSGSASNHGVASSSKASRVAVLQEPSPHVKIAAAKKAQQQQQQPFQNGNNDVLDQLQQLQVLRQQESSNSLSTRMLPNISEGHLMALIADVRTISELEMVVLQYHSHFRYNHVAAAVQKLPVLDMESSINMRQRFNHLTNLLASGLSNVAHLFDPFQAVGCLTALTSPCCLPPLRHGPLMRLLLQLLEDDAAGMWKLFHHQLAQCAAAAAAMQDAVERHGQRHGHQQQQQQQQQEPTPSAQVPLLFPPDLPATDAESSGTKMVSGPDSMSPTQQSSSSSNGRDAIAVLDDRSSSSTGTALTLQDPLQRFWQALEQVIKPQLTCFSADSLALSLLSFATAGRASEGVLMGVIHASLARPQKLAESPIAVTRMLKALVLTNKSDERLLSVLAAAVAAGAKTRDFFSPSQLAAAISALAHFDLYHEAALYTVCGVASATAMHWPRDAVISLLASLNRLEFRHDRFLRAAANALAAEGAAPPRHMLQADGNLDYLASSLAALLQLGCEAPALEDVLTGILRRVTMDDTETRPTALSPSGCIKLLWAAAVLEEPADTVLPLLLGGLLGVPPKSISQRDLRLLHQAYQLLGHRLGDTARDVAGVGRATAAAGPHVLSGDDQQQWWQQQWQQHKALLQAARQAAARHATASSSRGKLVAAIQDAFEDLGLEVPVQGFKVDGGALVPDLACVVSRRSSRGSRHDIKLALMCDAADRFSRNAPHELLGYWRVAGWLLEADGWKVVRFPVHEWQTLMTDRGVHEGSSMAFVFNTLQAQGVPL